MHSQETIHTVTENIVPLTPDEIAQEISTEIQGLVGNDSFVFVMNMTDGEMLLTAWQTDRAYVDIVADLSRLFGEPDGNASVPAAFVFSAIAPAMLDPENSDVFKTDGNFKLRGPDAS